MTRDASFTARVSLERGYVTYESPYGHAWSIPVAAVALVGRISVALSGTEPETFLVLAFRDLSWNAVPLATPGLDECLDALGALLGTRLAMEEEDRPRNDVLWPPSLVGSPFFAIASAEERDARSELSRQVVAFLSSGPVALGGIA